MDLITLRNKVIEKNFENLNDIQLLAATSVDGPLLVLAGAGSGKTTVLVNRIICLIKYGSAYKSSICCNATPDDISAAEDYIRGISEFLPEGVFSVNPAKPWEILAITFTNKAAGELSDRISAALGQSDSAVTSGTFHSVCGRILRRFADRIGYTSHFTIYDADDQRKLMKEIMKNEEIDEKMLPHRSVLNEISSAKDKLISPNEYAACVDNDYRRKKIAQLYQKYNARMFNNDAMDFDDMIVNTVKLFLENPDVLEYYQNRFKYIMVDEYQDTNHAQYMLVKLLAEKHRNICVVGDDDQSIYRFRGATIENILNFEGQYPDARVIRLEQNYRSTGNILDAANAVIKNNRGRKGKNLWTASGSGLPITVYSAADERDEARFVADRILENVREGGRFSDNAVLYRMNAQSNSLENVFARSGISYRVIGGMKFFERKEIKDILSYLTVINNPYDDLRLKRIINEPKRGIGESTVKKSSEISDKLGISLFEVFKTAADYPSISRSASKLSEFCELIENLRQTASQVRLYELLNITAEKTGYLQALRDEGPEEQDRIDNISELSSSIIQYEEESEEPTLSGFLEQISLFSDIDSYDDNDDRVVLMTVHSAKGLEFKNVYLVGMEEGVFPGNQSVYAGTEEIEEERRLAYVAITRARENLTVSNAYVRMIFGMTSRNVPSRFLKEIPEEICKIEHSGQTDAYFSAKINFEHNTACRQYSVQIANADRSKKERVVYKPGMEVEHGTFGIGMILSVTVMSDDSMLEVEFKEVGRKKIMANFAKLKII